jgi:hypothetical protein
MLEFISALGAPPVEFIVAINRLGQATFCPVYPLLFVHSCPSNLLIRLFYQRREGKRNMMGNPI